MITVNDVKAYLNLTVDDKDNFIQKLIDSVQSEFWYLFYRANEKVKTTSIKEEGSRFYVILKNLPTEIISVKGFAGNSEFVISEYTLYENEIWFLPRVDCIEIEMNRGFLELPESLKLDLVKIIALEFKRSFQGEGAIFYSGRTVGEVNFNFFQNVIGEINELKKKIFLKYGVGV